MSYLESPNHINLEKSAKFSEEFESQDSNQSLEKKMKQNET